MFSLFLIGFILTNAECANTFDEELLLKELGHGFTAFHFNFVSRALEYENQHSHSDVIPKSILDLTSKYGVDEVHLSLVRGFWDDERWGRNFVRAAPTGAELWAWFRQDTVNVDQSWFELTHALSGQFCASLNRLAGEAHSVIPRWSYRPTGISNLARNLNESKIMRYAQMPGEGLCSENLTPWVKLLPCKNLKGLASLLLPTALFLSNYQAVTLNLRRVCWDLSCSHIGFELSQTLTVVFDRRLIYGNTNIPWTVTGLLRADFKGFCDIARSSRVFILHSASTVKSNYSELPQSRSQVTDPRVEAVLSAPLFFESGRRISFTSRLVESTLPDSPFISVTKYVTGSGTADGGVRTIITSSSDFNLTIVYMDPLPWYTQVLFSTMKIHIRKRNTLEWIDFSPIRSHIVPSLSRERMGLLELVLFVPARHELAISYKFRRVLQRWDEYPPDANRGYFLPAASISYQIPRPAFLTLSNQISPSRRELALPNWAETYFQWFNRTSSTDWLPGDGFVRIHSPVLVIAMPTPDFSMPFNALCIVCSVVALLFGSVHKATACRLHAKLETSGRSNRLLEKLRKIFSKSRPPKDKTD